MLFMELSKMFLIKGKWVFKGPKTLHIKTIQSKKTYTNQPLDKGKTKAPKKGGQKPKDLIDFSLNFHYFESNIYLYCASYGKLYQLELSPCPSYRAWYEYQEKNQKPTHGR